MTTANERINKAGYNQVRPYNDRLTILTKKYNDLKKKYDHLVHLKKSNEQVLHMKIITLTKQLKVENFEANVDSATFAQSLKNYIEGVYGLDLSIRSRKRALVEARGMYYTLMRKYSTESLKNLGFTIGSFDHTTVIHSLNMTQDLIATQKVFRQEYEKHERFIEETLIKSKSITCKEL